MSKLLKAKYPKHSWLSHSGTLERGLDFIGTRHNLNLKNDSMHRLGVQVKYHVEYAYPTEKEWLQFLAGCFMQRIGHAIFITTGKLRAEQKRQAGEAGVEVIAGREEITRYAQHCGLPPCPED